MSKRVLLTGGLGFLGSHCVEHWLRNTDWHIVVLDALRFAGRIERLVDIEAYDPDRTTIAWHDLNAPIHSQLADTIGDVDYIVNAASDSHVDRSITNPVPFVKNNFNLMVTMLEFARQILPEQFIQIGTDEVFGPAPHGYDSKEGDPFRPSNPYSASKAAQDSLAYAWWRTYDVPVIQTNTMNLMGERQNVEKMVPMSVKRILADETISVHARRNPDKPNLWEPGSRKWLHARNLADALQFIMEEVQPTHYEDGVNHPVWFNISGERELDNMEVVELIGQILGKQPKTEMVDFHSMRPGHDLRYSLDGTLLSNAGWKPPLTLEESFSKAVKWYEAHPQWLKA